ncbi:MAG: Flp family type IVb pilin [Bacilli bacterium]
MKKSDNSGQTLVEYLFIIALTSVVAGSVVNLFGSYLKDSTTKNSCTLVDKVFVEGINLGEGTCVE